MADQSRVDTVRDMVEEQLAGYRVGSAVLLGESEDNVAYEVNGELVVRFGKESDPMLRAARVEREARLLAAVAGISTAPVPEPVFTVADQGCLAYYKLPGVLLLHMPLSRRAVRGEPVAAALGGLLTGLHAAPVDRVADLVATEVQPTALWLSEAAEVYPAVAAEVPVVYRTSMEAFLTAPPPAGEYVPVFSHNDLGIEHVLIDGAIWTVTGVIDWSDAAITDPAYDFGLLYRDLGPAAFDAALREYRTDVNDIKTLVERAVFYARCCVIKDLAYGLETGRDRYTVKSLAAMEWLFPG
ncbi:hypothetical protein Misp01_75690 [Microtetraspora sp. NBRC 13810]|uniref:phosphotransferase family protein n=1 Tax=Microtetraspora sp. NBRC 13810 TaxID=3030990 RepID=UPI00249FD55E|nr:phosphotransferase [Microtetraspora sp. NBRC 13810]GLW12441.1 hypothetical protein Misp01_75690 [Microtetraspora sp. NBRC 13810]